MKMKKPTLYAMAGTIGSGKTTFAKKLAKQKKAAFFSIDKHIKQLGQPIKTTKDYDRYYYGVRSVIEDYAVQLLRLRQSVVLDFGGSNGHWNWLKAIAKKTKSNIEIFHLLAPMEVRRERVKKRNLDPKTVFRFSAKEFNEMPLVSTTPKVKQKNLKITVINSI
jgi:predicted kinase